jgi:hypothetical protein
MSNRITIFALAAVATIGAASLISSNALAMGNHGVGNHGTSGKSASSGGSVGKVKVMPGTGLPPGVSPKPGNINKPGKIGWPHWHHRHHRHWWYYPVIVGSGGSSVAYAKSPTTVTPSTCNCLTKEYLADGSVLFKDLCTKEAAVMPASTNQAQQ